MSKPLKKKYGALEFTFWAKSFRIEGISSKMSSPVFYTGLDMNQKENRAKARDFILRIMQIGECEVLARTQVALDRAQDLGETIW
jgi:hypothetical protein